MTKDQYLPKEYCRCAGAGCDRRRECLRNVAFGDDRTPWVERYCVWGRESMGFILYRKAPDTRA